MEAASAIEAAALYILIRVVKYVGPVVAVPGLWGKATHAPFLLFETISILMASVLLTTLLQIY